MAYDKETQKRIDRAMDNKAKSIAWHNASNVAAELIKSYPFNITTSKGWAGRIIAYLLSVVWLLLNIFGIKQMPLKKNKKVFQETFIELRNLVYQEWMAWAMDNIVSEPKKLTAQDFIEAKAEAPKSQAEQDLAETLKEDEEKEKEEIKRSEAEEEYRGLPPEEEASFPKQDELGNNL